VQATRHASQQQQCRGVTKEKKQEAKRKRSRPRSPRPPSLSPRPPPSAHRLGHKDALRNLASTRGKFATPPPLSGCLRTSLTVRPTLKRASPTSQGCTPVAKSDAAKPDACKSNGDFTLAHVVYLVEYTARAVHVPLRIARGRVGGRRGGGGGGGGGEGS